MVAIADGDTLTVLDGAKTQTKIRLEGIDSPETGQAFGSFARKAIADKVFRGKVCLQRSLWRCTFGRHRSVFREGRRLSFRPFFVDGLDRPERQRAWLGLRNGQWRRSTCAKNRRWRLPTAGGTVRRSEMYGAGAGRVGGQGQIRPHPRPDLSWRALDQPGTGR